MWRPLLTMFLLPITLLAVAALRKEVFTGWAVINVLVFPLMMLFSIALHELGHAAAARLVGFDVPRIELGIGRRVARFRRGTTSLILNSFPLGGITYLGSARDHGIRWRLAVVFVAGPLSTLLVFVATCALVRPDGLVQMILPIRAVASKFALFELLLFLNGLAFAINLLPLPFVRAGGYLPNDGVHLVTLPFRSLRSLRELLAVSAVVEALDLLEHDDVEGAERLVREALERTPGTFVLRDALAQVLLRGERLTEARELYLELMSEPPPFPHVAWILRNNIAWTNFRMRVDPLRAEADEHSRAVFERFKHAPWALGTRAAVLTWLGRYGEAKRLLERAYSLHSSPPNRAQTACLLAVCYARLGSPDDAQKWVAHARANHARCPLLAEAEQELAAARSTLPGAR